MGVDRTLFLAMKVDFKVIRKNIKKVVRSCVECQSFDPAPTAHEVGEIHLRCNWRQLTVDVTHYQLGLTMIDCRP